MKKRNIEWKDKTKLEKIALIISIPLLLILLVLLIFDLVEEHINLSYILIGLELLCFGIIKNRSSVISYFIGFIGIIAIIIGVFIK